MNTNSKLTKEATLVQLQALIAGLPSMLPGGFITLLGTTYTTAEAVAVLQGLLTDLIALNTAQQAAQAALARYGARTTTWGGFLTALRGTLLHMYAGQYDKIGALGLVPPKPRTPLTAEKRVIAVAKARATREARGTKGSRQRLQITGTVTGVIIKPITATDPDPSSA